MTKRIGLALLLLAIGCGDDTSASGGAGAGGANAGGSGNEGGAGAAVDGGGGSDGGAPPEDKAALCDDTFGEELTDAFGRIDGTVLAVVRPADTQCPTVNDDHVVLEITMHGATYRAVVNIVSDSGDPDVRFLAMEHDMPGPPFEEGWHTGGFVDYVTDFGVHAGAPFEAVPMMELADRIADEITIGQKISVFSESDGGSSSHKIHRNDGSTDGAIILDPETSSPRVLLFHFDEQQF